MSQYGPTPWVQRHWDLRAAANFVAGGAGAGLVVVSVLSGARGMPAAVALLAGSALVGVGLLAVWLEIGRPLRALNVFLNPRTSWMSREAIASLVVRLRDPNQEVRRSVAQALERFGWQPGEDETGAWYWIARQEWPRCIALGDPAVKPLTLCLTVKDRDIQISAAVALGKLGEEGGPGEYCYFYYMETEPQLKFVLESFVLESGSDAEQPADAVRQSPPAT